MTGGITCVGGIVVDLLAGPVERVPAAGCLELVERMQLATGGCASNVASALARLGVQSHLVGAIGADDLGDYVIQAHTQRGVGLEGLVRKVGAPTSASMVLIFPGGERAILHTLGAASLFTDSDIRWEVVAGSRIFFIAQALLLPAFDGQPAARALARARQLGMLTALDTVWDATGAWLEKIGPCLPHLDFFLPSEAEARQLSGCDKPADMAAFFLDRGAGTVAIKLGERGCYLRRSGEPGFFLPPYRVAAVDATGAGDCWCAGFLAGIYKGLPLAEAGRMGNAAGASCVTAMGATAGLRTWDELLTFMQTTPEGEPCCE